MRGKRSFLKMITAALAGAALLVPAALPAYAEGTVSQAAGSAAQSISTEDLSFDVSQFVLPSDARTLIVTEGFAQNGGRDVYGEGYVEDSSRWNKARVTVFVRDGEGEPWVPKVQSPAVYGWGGMSNNRHAGDGTTPIGLFKTNTPFGRREAEEGFPADYQEIMISEKTQYWSGTTNRLETDPDQSKHNGERLYEDWARVIYSYCLDSGFNKNNYRPGTGSALFLHCTKDGKPSTAGCVAMDERAMIQILRYYARGGCYCAIAPEGTFSGIYNALTENGDQASGSFPMSEKQMPETPVVILP
ncbi:MAG: L,D-transpeptidase family protein [Stomatobaculum sp.]|nr:L,D-transpeptidase family protein [Stomatobaculum sp.]